MFLFLFSDYNRQSVKGFDLCWRVPYGLPFTLFTAFLILVLGSVNFLKEIKVSAVVYYSVQEDLDSELTSQVVLMSYLLVSR